MKKELIIKEWIYDKIEAAASGYNYFVDKFNELAEDLPDGFVVVVGEVIGETEKAVRVDLMTGGTVGSTKGWMTWIPKSAILNN